ncbi:MULTISPECIES: glycosyltransferase family 2 protein [unclassified Polaromonas]|uniref:glycosyltransferase family 2 protein n=1 Tax=unclassified Polaromonas TaxID=2638319 RepID=UPI0025D793CC|nr:MULTISPECIES: glycosyltransferase family 2 protein [unclassified Polaromonas]
MERASVSVVIPCYCCESTIHRAIESIAQQTLLPLELILVDDVSPDDGLTHNILLKMVEQFSSIIPIKVIAMTENQGPGSARNRGWDEAKGDYIAFLDADDTWHPRKLEIQHAWMLNNPTISMSGHPVVLDGKYLPELTGDQIEDRLVSFSQLLIKNCFPTPSVMVLRSFPFRYLEGFRQAEDYLLWLSIVGNAYPAALLDAPLASVHKGLYGDSGLSGDLYGAYQGVLRAYKILENQGLISKLTYLMLHAYSYLKYLRRLIIISLNRP